MKRKIVMKYFVGMIGMAAMLAVMTPETAAAEARGQWVEENGGRYWYEDGVKQGLDGRGKEIYDPVSNAWYWLDSIDGGRMAAGKDVYQTSLAGEWGDSVNAAGEKTGKWVRYDNNGHMVKGWQTTSAGTYYFDGTYGTMAKGAAVIDGKPCAFDRTTGIGINRQWYVIDGVNYWYENGVRQGLDGRGKEIYDPASDAWYWLDAIENGKMAAGKDVYQDSNGGKWVRYDGNGRMVKGWNEQNGNRYYFDPVTGAMAKGRVEIDGASYYFDEITGICQDESRKSYGLGVAYHTENEVRSYMASSGINDGDIHGVTAMEREPNFAAPYEKGAVAQESQNKALAMLNQMRYIAGLDANVTINDSYTQMAQAGAFLNAVNNKLSHYPTRPSDMSEELYQLGSKGASSSNIAYTSWKTSLPYSILLWMDDSDASNIDRLGHRRWILNPPMKETGFGYASNSGTYTSVYAFDTGNWGADVKGVAWPAQEMPLAYFNGNMAWSYSYGSALSDVSVKLTRLGGNGQEWNFRQGSGDGFFNVENSNYGQKGCVIFKPQGLEIQAGDRYLVTISAGGNVIADYTVHFF